MRKGVYCEEYIPAFFDNSKNGYNFSIMISSWAFFYVFGMLDEAIFLLLSDPNNIWFPWWNEISEENAKWFPKEKYQTIEENYRWRTFLQFWYDNTFKHTVFEVKWTAQYGFGLYAREEMNYYDFCDADSVKRLGFLEVIDEDTYDNFNDIAEFNSIFKYLSLLINSSSEFKILNLDLALLSTSQNS